MVWGDANLKSILPWMSDLYLSFPPFLLFWLAPFVGLAADNPLQAHITGKALKAGRPLSVRLRVSSFEAMCGLVARGVGVAILPLAALQRSAFQTQLRAWPLQDAWATRTLYLCAPSFAQLTPQAATLAEHILAASRPNAD